MRGRWRRHGRSRARRSAALHAITTAASRHLHIRRLGCNNRTPGTPLFLITHREPHGDRRPGPAGSPGTACRLHFLARTLSVEISQPGIGLLARLSAQHPPLRTRARAAATGAAAARRVSSCPGIELAGHRGGCSCPGPLMRRGRIARVSRPDRTKAGTSASPDPWSRGASGTTGRRRWPPSASWPLNPGWPASPGTSGFITRTGTSS